MNETAGPAILAEGLVKRYAGREGTVEAVNGVDLESPPARSSAFWVSTGPESRRRCACSRRC